MIPAFRPEATRRSVLARCAAATGAAWVAAVSSCAAARETRAGSDEADAAEVTPGEDLMQEHGMLERLLLVYSESAERLDRGDSDVVAVVAEAAAIVRSFVEEYHESLEERHVFPRLETAGRELELVSVLRVQHRRGHECTDRILRAAEARRFTELGPELRGFVRMYRPHAATEDTVLFPAFRGLLGREAYRELGERFEEEEHARFGAGGFEAVLLQVRALEGRLGIGDLSRFTVGA